jgi:DNA-binding XRE family transcriptional regulator
MLATFPTLSIFYNSQVIIGRYRFKYCMDEWVVEFSDEFDSEFKQLSETDHLNRLSGVIMGRSLSEVTDGLSPELRQKIASGTKDLILEVEALRLKQLRERWGISQQELAKILNVSQPAVSKLENQPDLMLSTLRQYVESLGGNLEILVTFPDRPSIRLEMTETGEQLPVEKAVLG